MSRKKKKARQRANRFKRIAKRLAAYSAAAAVTAAVSHGTANAAPVVWDIPDVTVAEVDIDRGVFFNMINGATSIGTSGGGAVSPPYVFYNFTQGKFRLHPGDGGYIYGPAYVGAAGALGFIGSVPGTLAYANPIAASNSVKAADTFEVSGPWYQQFYAFLNWADGQTAFSGIRFDLGANTHYGWAQITRVDSDNFTLHGFGYNTTPDAASHPVDTVVPEPSSIMLLAAGAAGLASWRRRRSGKAADPR